MDKSDPPTTLGVFKPVGHTVVAFRTEDEQRSAVLALKDLGFGDDALELYSSAEMAAQVAGELLAASPLASFGYELDLVRTHGKLAKQGCCFLVVDAPTDALSAQVAALVRRLQPEAAQHYGSLMIQDLTEQAPGGTDAP